MLATGVGTFAQLRQGDPLSLPLANQVALKLGECSHDAQKQVRHGGVLTRKGQVLFLETDLDAAPCQSKNDLPQIIQVPGQPVHRMADDRIALSDIADELFELRTVEALAGGFVDESHVELHTFQLAELFLVKGADAQVADELTSSLLSFMSR